jgi:phosphate transport system permease protein
MSSASSSLIGTGRRRANDAAFRWLTGLSAGLILVVLLVVVVELAIGSQPIWVEFGLGFITGDSWDPGAGIYGALPFIAGTLLTTAIATALAVPIALLTAIYLAEMAPPRLATPLIFAIELIAAIPSVVIGLWGLLVITPIVRDFVEAPVVDAVGGSVPIVGTTALGSDIFAASLVLALMIAPTIIAISREVLSSVPMSYREAYLGLGATRWETIRKIVVPAARAGIGGAILLGVGRAIGETMAVTMMIGNADRIPQSLFDQGQTVASKVATTFPEASGLEVQALLALGLVLMGFTLLVSIVARLLIGRRMTSTGGG